MFKSAVYRVATMQIDKHDYDILTCEIIFDGNCLLSPLPHLNLLVYDRNIFGSFSVVFVNLRQSSKNVRKCSGNVLKGSSGLRNNFGKSSENSQKRRHQYVYIINRTLHVSSKKKILFFWPQPISYSFAALSCEI